MDRNESVVTDVADIIKGIAGRVIVLALMVLAVYVCMTVCYRFGHDIFYPEPAQEAPGTDVTVTIEEGDDIDSIAEMLAEQGIITNELAFRIQGRLYKANVHPGVYDLNTSMTTKEILSVINLTESEYNDKIEQENAAAEDASGVVGGGSDGD